MTFFQRSVHSNVKELDPDTWLVSSDLLDLEHSIHIELTVRRSDSMIVGAQAQMSKVPFSACSQSLDTVKKVEGLTIGRGILLEVNRRLGGSASCAHLGELVTEAVRIVAMLNIGQGAGYYDTGKHGGSEEEAINRLGEKLKNTCIVFADKAKKA